MSHQQSLVLRVERTATVLTRSSARQQLLLQGRGKGKGREVRSHSPPHASWFEREGSHIMRVYFHPPSSTLHLPLSTLHLPSHDPPSTPLPLPTPRKWPPLSPPNLRKPGADRLTYELTPLSSLFRFREG